MVQKLKKQKPIAKTKEQPVVHLKTEMVEEYSGLIPHPRIVEGYENLCPGAADRILKMAEDELEHKRELEKKDQDSIIECRELALKWEIKTNIISVLCAFLLIFSMIVGGFILLFKGKKIEGFVSIVTAVSAVIGSVLWKWRHSKNNNDDNDLT